MPRKKLHQSVKDRVKAHRHSKLESSNTKVFCSVCNENVLCTSDPALSLARHKASSSKHKRLLQGIYFVDDSDSDMEIAEADSSKGLTFNINIIDRFCLVIVWFLAVILDFAVSL